jgi:hypothetical protein
LPVSSRRFRPIPFVSIVELCNKYFTNMNFASIDRLPRLSKDETKELVKRHSGLRNLFPKKGVVWHCSQDILIEGFLQSSRFSNPELSTNRSAKTTPQANAIHADDESETDSTYLSEHQHSDPTAHKDQKRKFAISLATLAAKPYKRSVIAKDGGIKTLLELSGMTDPIVRRSCSIALSLLSKEQSLRPRMVDEGVILTLVSLSSAHNYFLKMNCCQALCNLFCEPGSEPRAVRDGGSQALIRIAAICPDATDNALRALVNLSCVHEKFQRIEELNEVLFYFNDTAVLNDNQRLLLLSALCNLSAIRNNQLRLVEDGCLRIVEWAWSSVNPNMRIRGSEIIRNLTTEYRARGKMVENNLITMLLAMANDELEEVRVCAVKALYILSKDSSCRQKIVTGSGMDVLLMLSTSNYQNIEIGRTTARVWRILCKDPNAAPKAVNFGVVKAFVSLLTSSGDDQYIQQYIAESICLLLSHSDTHVVDFILADSILTVIVILIRSYREVVTSEWLAYALYLITTAQVNSAACDGKNIESGILPSLIKLSCSLNSSEYTKCLCSGCFVNLTLLKDVEAVKAIPILVYLLRNETNMITRMNCSTSLYNLSYNDDNCYQMLDAGVLMPIVEFVVKSDRDENLLSSRSHNSTGHGAGLSDGYDNGSGKSRRGSVEMLTRAPSMSGYLLSSLSNSSMDEENASTIKNLIRTKIKCAAILSRLTLFEKYYHLFINNNHDLQLLHVLLKLSIVDDLSTQRRVVSALANLTKNPFLRVKLLSLNPMSYILSLASKRDEKLWYGCCCIICNLSYEYGSERMMVEGGIVPTLLITALINTDSISSKIICVKALANLLTVAQDDGEEDEEYGDDFDSDDFVFIESSMVRDGVIWGLSSLAMLENKELLSICTKILFRISNDHAKEIMESAAAVRALIKIINCVDDLELLRLGGDILTNILLNTNQNSTAMSLRGSRPTTQQPQDNKNSQGVKESKSSTKDQSFRNNIVNHMKALASSDDPEVMKSCINSLYLISESGSSSCKAIVTSGLLRLVIHGSYDKSLIFSSKIISLSYLTLINNVAKAYSEDESVTPAPSSGQYDDGSELNLANALSNFDILKALLDEEFLSGLHRIVDHGDEELDITAMKGVYIFSCHQETVKRLASDEHDIISLINHIWYRETYEKSIELIELIVAVLFNISACESIQGVMVSQGIVKTLVSVWKFVYDNAYLDDQMINAITAYALSTAAATNPALNALNAGASGFSTGGNNRVTAKLIPAASIKVNKPVAGLAINSSTPTTSGIRSSTRLSFSPTNSSFYAISNNSLNNGSFVSGYSTVTTVNINFGNPVAPTTENSQEALDLISNHQIFMKLCILVCSAISHLGCGNVNSAKMIEDGCGSVLVFITQSHKSPNFLNYIFDYPIYHRCSASLRNLLLSIANQADLIAKGCLQGLIDLFALITRAEQQSIAVETTATAVTNNNPLGSVPNSSNPTHISRSEREMRILISKNCASALRSLTYNTEERPSLLASGAINVILADLRDELADDETSIDGHLLHEIEAESWQNGIRRQQREERAKPITTAKPCIDYLDAEPFRQRTIEIVVDVRPDLLEKFYVSNMESYDEESANGVGQNGQQLLQFQQLEDTISVINIKLDDLESYEESEDMSLAITQQYPKLEAEINDEELLNQLKMPDMREKDKYESTIDGDRSTMTGLPPLNGELADAEQSMLSLPSSSRGISSGNGSSPINGRSLVLTSRALPPEISALKAGSMQLNDISTTSGKIASPKNQNKESALAEEEKQPNSSMEQKISRGAQSKKLLHSKARFNPAPSSDRAKIHTITNASVLIPGKFKNAKKDKFGEIVAKINSAKEGENTFESVDQILNEWKNIGRR